MAYIDLDELDEVFSRHAFWSLERLNIVSFRRADYLGESGNLRESVHHRIREEGIEPPSGAVRMLTHLRYFGYCFNPVTFYFCFDADGAVEVIVAEITNTPWDERHAYVLDVRRGSNRGNTVEFEFQKDFHVSPFPRHGLPLSMDLHESG